MSHGEDGTQFGYEDHFTPARSARKKKRKNRPHPAPPSPAVLLDRVSEELAEGAWLRATQIAPASLRESLDEAFPASDAAPGVLCLGLGSPAASRDARAQLAFLLAACDDLRIDRANVSAYDPVFAADDLQLLAQLGVAPLPENRRASYGLRGPTIAFMPHCDLDLYENVLRENWSRARLPNILLIANRLHEYADSIPSRKLAAEHPCVARLVPHLTTRPLQPCAAFPTAFNNTAIQHVAPARLAARDADWWTLPQAGPGAPRARFELEESSESVTDGRAPADAVAAAETPAGIRATATASTGATTTTATRTTTRSNAAAGEGAAAGEARARAGDAGLDTGVGNGNVDTTATGRAESSSSLASSAAPLPSPSRPGSRPGPRGSTGPSPGAGARDGEWTGGRARADAGVASPDVD
ncbi:hypothetical protein C2E23DRAFT_894228 [Lenzites betulinus]|nr:hypothetical protein C2E23DRAFT_894228 [Lenzites betulinus]